SASISTHFFTTSAGFCEKVVMVLFPVGPCLPCGLHGVSCCLDWKPAAANNKTAADRGRCLHRAYREGVGWRQATETAFHFKNYNKNSMLKLRYYFTSPNDPIRAIGCPR